VFGLQGNPVPGALAESPEQSNPVKDCFVNGFAVADREKMVGRVGLEPIPTS